MGDRNDPMKFGPEWIRFMPGAHMPPPGNGSGGTPSTGGGTNTSTSAAAMANTTSNTATKVQLADHRYGKEEFLALFDKTVEAPRELKNNELLYQRKGKAPIVLKNSYDVDMARGSRDLKNSDMLYQRRGKPSASNTSFENEMRDNMRGGPPIDPMSLGDRLGLRSGRGSSTNDNRAKNRLPFTRMTTSRSTSWHLGSSRMPTYGASTEEESHSFRYWCNNNPGNANNRNGNEPTDRNNSKFRRRQGNNTNWRQPRDETDEWRLSDSNRPRSTQQDKWERDWGDRPGQDRPQSWSTSRRPWSDRSTQNCEENVPEWAVDNTELCAGASGTFDSSGAFHGYSSDDTSLPKNEDSSYPLTRSHTHDSFARSKTTDEALDEWWASEKAKKLSPKRFDTSDLKLKKQSGNRIPEETSSATSSSKSGNKEESSIQEVSEKVDLPSAPNDPSERDPTVDDNFNKSLYNPKFTENKKFDPLIRSDINIEERDERGNFQSVMITPNNSLRQKHQNIVSPVNENRNRQSQRVFLKGSSGENELGKDDVSEGKIVEEIVDMALDDKLTKLPPDSSMPSMNPSSASVHAGISNVVNSIPSMSNPVLPNQNLIMNTKPNHPTSGMQAPGIQNVGITNSALNASLGLPIGNNGNIAMRMPIQAIPPPMLSNTGLGNSGIGATGLSGIGGIPGFQSASAISGLSTTDMSNTSLFLGQSTNNVSMTPTSDIQLQNPTNQGNMFPMHNLPHSNQPAFGISIVSNIMSTSQRQTLANNLANNSSLFDCWYYEDPKKNVQGPFTSKEMYYWYRAGFFTPNLMVRRACEAHMRPLGTYGSVVPFAQIDVVINENTMDPGLQFGGVGLMRNSTFGQQQMVDSLWNQSSSSTDLMWMQQSMGPLNESRVNNLPMFFWDQQTPITSNSLLPKDVEKKMKTEAQILAQLRMTTSNTPQNVPFMNEQPSVTVATTTKSEETPTVSVTTQPTAAPNLEELQKLIPKENIISAHIAPAKNDPILEPPQPKEEKVTKTEPPVVDNNNSKAQQVTTSPNKISPEPKTNKNTKNENEKMPKNRENNNTKSKNKKNKDDKKEETTDAKVKDEEVIKVEQRKSEETSQTRNKKEDKLNKKEIEKEKKEWLKEGFTIVKGAEKSPNKDKKKADEAKAAEEAERKRKEEERQAAEEEKKRKQAEALKKQQEQQQLQQQKQAAESVCKKAPWTATHRDGPTLAEIQRLEREKKMEQMKEQQQMMQIIAQQQAVALAREQEMNAGLGWAKKKGTNLNLPGQSLAEIQTEGRKQAAAVAAAASYVTEEVGTTQSNHVAWANIHNGGGFWDCPPSQPAKEQPQEFKRNEQSKNKKKNHLGIFKKEVSPAAEFEFWCTNSLAAWSSKIDVPTFIGFLKDIESPYEVKDYVKCYLGDSRDSNDFARQFIERRSKVLRVGMVTPSDDLCSPAIAVNPRPQSGTEYQEVKSKTKKTKKNKMLKVDARILGFSVTAAEDRINVGDIDTV